MELAVNMFTGGMVLDSHPLVQSSDTLSDALNATYITMNGNEVVLLNDMGNRRVDNAYLPAGYEPVGIKEHGGIIYIAAYNPITHRSLIGSFPSPERNMGVEYKDNGTKFSLSDFIGNENIITKEGIRYLKDDVILLPLTNDTSLHAGDKFTVYSGDVWSWGNNGLLTNFGTENLGIPLKYNKTPFNSYFTLSLGVVNSLNEFSDITNSLERFNSSGNIIKGLDIDKDKFNTGYFIAPGSWDIINGLTNTDSTLISEREKIGANTYAYKLTGPLYLKAELNHILTFSYSMNISKTVLETLPNETPKFKIDLYITGTAVYNCPDSNDVNPYFDSFKFFYKNLDLNSLEYTKYNEENNNSIISQETRIFDSTTGLYTSTITKHYIFTLDINYSSSTLNYLITVPIFHEKLDVHIIDNDLGTLDEYNVFISRLSESGSLDISKIGTNECELGMWRYKNTIEDNKVTSTILDFRFDCYRDLVTTFKDLNILLINQTTPSQNPITLNNIIPIQSEISTGRQLFLIDWTAVEEEKRINFLELYLAKITYNQYTEAQALPSPKTIYRFILGTKLFNPCYDESNSDYTSDFGIFMGEADTNSGWYKYHHNPSGSSANDYTNITTVTLDRNDLRKKYLNLWDKITIKEDPKLYSDLTSSVIDGKPISTRLPYNTYSQKINNYSIKIKYNTGWKIEDKELFIKNTEVVNFNTDVSISLNEGITNDIETSIIKSDNLEENVELEFLGHITKIPASIQISRDSSNNVISFPFILYDRIYINYNLTTKYIGKAYVNLNNSNNQICNALYRLMNNEQRYFCICTQINEGNAGGYCGYVNSDNIYGGNALIGGSHNIWGVLDYVATIYIPLFNSIDYLDSENYDPNGAYESLIKPFFRNMKCPFTFGFSCSRDIDSDKYHISNNYYMSSKDPNFDDFIKFDRHFRIIKNDINRYSAQKYTRVWWVDEDGNPCLLNNLSGRLSSGLFYAGSYLNEDLGRERIYDEILFFLGSVIVGTGNNKQVCSLVVPLENFPYEAYYVDNSSYLYSENTEINLNVKLNYVLSKNTPELKDSGITYKNLETSCLKFYIGQGEKTIEKKLNKKYYLGEFSLSIFDLAQLLDLSSYDIDLETGRILSNNNPIKKLYIRNSFDKTLLKEVPENFPILINQGTKNNFPIVCKKRYNPYTNEISNDCMVNPAYWLGDGNLSYYLMYIDSKYGIHTPWARSLVCLNPSTKNIPILYEEDLAIYNDYFFNT